MMRLNNSMRATIISGAKDRLFKKQIEELRNSARVLILKVYEELVSKEDIAKLKSLPPHLVVRTTSVKLFWKEDNTTFYLKDLLKGFHDRAFQLHDPIFHAGCEMGMTKPVHINRAKWISARLKELEAKKQAALKELEALLNQCRTIEQLTQLWPEGRKYLREFKEVTDGMVKKEEPKVPVVILNKDLLKEGLK